MKTTNENMYEKLTAIRYSMENDGNTFVKAFHELVAETYLRVCILAFIVDHLPYGSPPVQAYLSNCSRTERDDLFNSCLNDLSTRITLYEC